MPGGKEAKAKANTHMTFSIWPFYLFNMAYSRTTDVIIMDGWMDEWNNRGSTVRRRFSIPNCVRGAMQILKKIAQIR